MTATTISDMERREVAERLRSVAREVLRSGFVETIRHVKLAVFEDADRYRPNGTLDRLADLIDPDLRDESFCKVCGHVIPDGWSECPRCRSKVVSDD